MERIAGSGELAHRGFDTVKAEGGGCPPSAMLLVMQPLIFTRFTKMLALFLMWVLIRTLLRGRFTSKSSAYPLEY
jgi:hypothetical protein